MGTFKIDRSLESEGVFQYTTDSGCKYIASISESAPNSGLATLDFMLVSGSPSYIEVFKTMRTLYEISTEYVLKKGFKNLIFYIDGANREEIDQKTNIFTRWIDTNIWEYRIDPQPYIIIPNMRNGIIPVNTNAIVIKKKDNVVIESVKSKFCHNCGSPNNNYKFCPDCGQNLQEG